MASAMTSRFGPPLPLLLSVLVTLATACGGEAAPDIERTGADAGADRPGEGGAAADAGGGAGNQRPDTFVPEEEEFLVREVATTDRYVFVPNSAPDSTTVARIDGRDLSVLPIEVGRKPVAVRAASVDKLGSIAYVLSEGSSTVTVMRADAITKDDDATKQMSFQTVPEETNAIVASPDGRHLLAYIDPDQPLPSQTSVASLQVMALVRLGDTPAKDVTHELSVTRQIDDIEFTDDGSQAFIIGREGINHLRLSEIDSDAFIRPLKLKLSDSAFPPTDREVEVSPDGEFLVIRSSASQGLALFQLPKSDKDKGTLRKVDLPAIPTDIDLHVPDSGSASVIATLRSEGKVALIDVQKAFQSKDTSSAVTLIDAKDASPGLSQLTPDRENVFLYTTLVTTPKLGLLDLKSRKVRTYKLRNQIRSVAVAPDSKSAVVVHEKQSGQAPDDASAVDFFRHNFGVTLFDIPGGYLRPVTLEAKPVDVILTQTTKGVTFLYAIVQSKDATKEGLVRINMQTYRSDFFNLPRKPTQLGQVAGKVFVNQKTTEGRITFVDVETGERQTVSGYELNARIE